MTAFPFTSIRNAKAPALRRAEALCGATRTDQGRDYRMRHKLIRDDAQRDLFGGTTAPRATDPDSAFAAFWRAYPRRVAKGAARKAFARAVKHGVAPATIIAG